MRNIMRAIARLLGIQTQLSEVPVEQTPTAGLVNQELIQQFGSKPSVQDTKRQRQSSPAQPRSAKKQKPAQHTTAASKDTSKKQKPAQTAQSPKVAGYSSQTPASKTRRHAKQAAKPNS